MQPPDPGRVIFLNGVPNAGKTTLAEAIQVMLAEPYWHLSLDDFLRGYTFRHRSGSSPPSFLKVMRGYLHSLRQMALCGNNIVTEAVITPDRLPLYLDLFGDLPVLLIGLHVPLQEARLREEGRSDRTHYEVTPDDIVRVHAHKLYDLELDTHRLTPEEAARRVVELVDAPPSPTASARLMSS